MAEHMARCGGAFFLMEAYQYWMCATPFGNKGPVPTLFLFPGTSKYYMFGLTSSHFVTLWPLVTTPLLPLP